MLMLATRIKDLLFVRGSPPFCLILRHGLPNPNYAVSNFTMGPNFHIVWIRMFFHKKQKCKNSQKLNKKKCRSWEKTKIYSNISPKIKQPMLASYAIDERCAIQQTLNPKLFRTELSKKILPNWYYITD